MSRGPAEAQTPCKILKMVIGSRMGMILALKQLKCGCVEAGLCVDIRFQLLKYQGV